MHDRRARLHGTLLGTAVGDALGLPAEGMSARGIARRWGRVERFSFLGRWGVVSDDTEQSALVAQALARHGRDVPAVTRALRRSLLGWFLRLPWGIGLGTLRACTRMALGLRRTGVRSAGNGAAMRSAVVGVHIADDPALSVAMTRSLAALTHVDPRAVEGAVYVAALAREAALCEGDADREALARRALSDVADEDVRAAVGAALDAAAAGADTLAAAKKLGCTGFVLHTVALATYVFVRFGDRPMAALTEIVSAGGDTDSNAAIVGAWVGALHGAGAWPREVVGDLMGGAFGERHLRGLADALAGVGDVPRFSWVGAACRNVALFPVVLVQGVRVLWGR